VGHGQLNAVGQAAAGTEVQKELLAAGALASGLRQPSGDIRLVTRAAARYTGPVGNSGTASEIKAYLLTDRTPVLGKKLI